MRRRLSFTSERSPFSKRSTVRSSIAYTRLQIGVLYAKLGQKEKAFDYLNQALEFGAKDRQSLTQRPKPSPSSARSTTTGRKAEGERVFQSSAPAPASKWRSAGRSSNTLLDRAQRARSGRARESPYRHRSRPSHRRDRARPNCQSGVAGLLLRNGAKVLRLLYRVAV